MTVKSNENSTLATVTIIYYHDESLELMHEIKHYPKNGQGRIVIPEDFNEKLKVLLSPHRQTNQGSRVNIRYGLTEAEATLSLGESWKVNPSDDLLGSLKREFGEKRVKIDYI